MKNEYKIPYRPYWLITTATVQLILIYLAIDGYIKLDGIIYQNILEIDTKNLEEQTTVYIIRIGTLFLYNILFWFYCIISILKNDFKKDINKITWLITMFFAPFLWMVYLDFERVQVEKE